MYMAHDWILDVLVDLREFARKNSLELTEKQLSLALISVSDELASMQGIAPQNVVRNVGHVREFSGALAEGQNSQ